jgi:xanthine dehydrogenase YagR molybdenum-binding subunit
MSAPTVGQGIDRVDGKSKVCGRATYAAEFALQGMTHAVLVLSTVPSGRIVRMSVENAERARGVMAVLTPINAARLPNGGKAAVEPPAGRVLALLQDSQVHYNGQPIGVVVADTLEHAADAARMVTVTYGPADAALDFDAAKRSPVTPEKVNQEKTDTSRGDVDKGVREGSTTLRETYTTPIEHHNPMEPHATVATWAGDRLTVYDSTQYVTGVKQTMAKTLGIPPDSVTVISPFVGGGFGCKGSMWSHVVLAAMASRRVGRPVKLVLERPQMFAMVGNRPHTEQALTIAARDDGAFSAMRHDTISETSMLEDWVEPSAVLTRMLYSCPNLSTSHRLAKMNVGTPTFMRAPGESSGSFALETAVDEMAVRLKMDPIALRLRNYAESDENKNTPFSSKTLRECYRVGAEQFGWARRSAAPGSTRSGRWRVGLGMATASYPANRSAAEAMVRVMPDGSAVVMSGTQDIGTGTYTVMTQVAADALGFPIARVRFELGDSRMPKAPVSGGSQSVASVSPAVKLVCENMRGRLIAMALADLRSPVYGAPADGVSIVDGVLRSATGRSETVGALVTRCGGQPIVEHAESKPGSEREAYSMHSFGAVFAEVWVDADLGTIRVPRITGAYAVGRLLNAKTARSQLLGGIVWGVGMALFEESRRDGRNGRIVNANLAEYHVPVNADIGRIDIEFVPEDDPHINPLGAKGIGEIGITGVAAAIGNAAYNATGRRVRTLPFTLDKFLQGSAESL